MVTVKMVKSADNIARGLFVRGLFVKTNSLVTGLHASGNSNLNFVKQSPQVDHVVK